MPSITQNITIGRSDQEKNGPWTTRAWLDRDAVRAANVRGIYIHVPFCFHKCHYCDFYSVVDRRDRRSAFVERLIADITDAKAWLTSPIETIFVGGGTPTLLPAEDWQQILAALAGSIPCAPECEFTIEANPETVTDDLAAALVAGGVNRVSIGAQSFHGRHLQTLERHHDPANVERSVTRFRNAGIGNINLDLIFAIPGQTLDEWAHDLETAVALEPDHLSCYGLTYEPNTPMTARMHAGQFDRADEDLEAAMYEHTARRLTDAGFVQYEISNWARTGSVDRRCRHNLLYWTNGNWWPIGPGAAGHIDGSRWKIAPRLDAYIDNPPGDTPITDAESLDEDIRIGELLMLGLRLNCGLPITDVETMLSSGVRGQDRRFAIDRALDNGLLILESDYLKLTDRGRLLADSVLIDLI